MREEEKEFSSSHHIIYHFSQKDPKRTFFLVFFQTHVDQQPRYYRYCSIIMSIPTDLDTRFREKHIIITGAGGNFGREGCIYFALRGARVVALDNNATALDDTVSLVRESVKSVASGNADSEVSIVGFECDVTNPSSVNEAVEKAVEAFGVPDLLWNNAGYQGQIKPTLEYSVQDFAMVMNIK